jgi:5S rRNA maturation endonuclease (ribonuclease M5)
MAYCICRIAKLKSGGAITASEQHTLRTRETLNADLSKENERFIGNHPIHSSIPLEQEVFERIGEQPKKIRSDAVLCVEMMLTASPEYFRPDDQGRAGKWNAEQLEQWKQANYQWLNETYGEKIVRAELHLDESTPHIHAYLVPLDQNNKLNCKSYFGGRQKLREFQDSYAEAMAPLDLERGIKGSRATYTQVKDYYAAVTKDPDEDLTPEEIQHQLSDRQIVLKQNADLERTAKSLAQQTEQLEQQLKQQQTQLEQYKQESLNWRDKYQALTVQLREIPLTQVAHELGLDPDPKDKYKWRNEQSVINITGQKFYDFKEMKGGGGAIDLVMYVERCKFGEAVHWLKDRFGESVALETITQQTRQTIEEKPRQPFIRPVQDEACWPKVRDYLTKARMLPTVQVDKLHEQGLVYADENQNAVFVRRSLEGEVMGASLRGTAGKANSFKGLALGTRRSQGWFYIDSEHSGSVKQVVLCESAIDVMSYKTLHPAQEKTLYLSTDGAGYVPLEQLRTIPKIAICFDNDQAGAEMAERLKQDLPQAEIETPQQKDWNGVLQEHLRQVQQHLMQQQQIRRKQQQQPEIKQDRGMSL